MPPEQPLEYVTSADDLTETDEEILDELRKGARTKGALVDATGRHRNTVGHRLDILEASGHIAEIHDSTALYELNNDPRPPEVEGVRVIVCIVDDRIPDRIMRQYESSTDGLDLQNGDPRDVIETAINQHTRALVEQWYEQLEDADEGAIDG